MGEFGLYTQSKVSRLSAFMTKIVSPEMFGDLGYLFFSIIGGINYL